MVLDGNPFSSGEEISDQDLPACSTSSIIHLGAGLAILLDHVLFVDEHGMISHLIPANAVNNLETIKVHGYYIALSKDEFLCPGMIDLHIHAPQYAFTGTATDRPLMGANGWLETYTFPAERRLRNSQVLAKRVYDGVVQKTLQSGTTTAVYYGTLDLEPCQILVDSALQFGQRALIGKVCMDRNSPDDYCQTLQDNVRETEMLIEYIYAKAGRWARNAKDTTALPLILPIITPRFIPTCTPELLTALGELAVRHNCHVQTHLSESHDEVTFSRFLDAHHDLKDGVGRTDAQILDAHQLLTNQCVLAHAVHMSTDDMDLVRHRGSAVAHCPLSNFFFAGGSLHCRELVERGNLVGLGTDVAGGYSPSMLDSCRCAVIASRAVEHQQHIAGEGVKAKDHVMDFRHAFYLATVGGAKSLGLQDRIGNLQAGMEFDAFILSNSVEQSVVQVFDEDSVGDVLQKLLVLGDDRNVKRVFVRGRDVTVK